MRATKFHERLRTFTLTIAAATTAAFSSAAWAQSQTQDELDAAIELMRAQGMPEAQIEQFKRTVQPIIQQGAAQQKERDARERQATEKKKTERAARKAAEAGTLRDAVAAVPGVLTIGAKGETFPLSVRSCSMRATQAGNLMRMAWIEAEGEFRGANVIATLSKSHPVGSPSSVFEHLELWIVNRTPAEQALDNSAVLDARQDQYTAWHAPRQAEIMARYQPTDDMSLEELNASMEARQAALDALEEEGRPREIHSALLNGSVVVEDGVASVLSDNFGWRGRGKMPDAFFDLDNTQIYAVAQCP